MGSIRRWLGLDDRTTLPMALLCFLICFIHCNIRNMKDSLVITAPGANAEVVPFIQLWMMLPATLVATYLFTRFATRHTRERLFYSVIGAFLAFFAFFTFVLYPLRDVLHPTSFADHLALRTPQGLHGLIGMWRNWIFSVFYTVSELWACMVTSVLFWSFANEITRVEAARHCYGLYTLGGNLGATVAGAAPWLVDHITPEQAVYTLMGVIMVACMAMMALFRWLNTRVLHTEAHASLRQPGSFSKFKGALSLKQCLKELLGSKYLLCLAVIVVAYNLVLNIGELVWKDQIKSVYPNFSDYNIYLGYTTTCVGLGSMVLAALLPRILNRLGWAGTALVCPIALLATGIAFLGTLYLSDQLPFDRQTVLLIALFFGALMDIAGRMTKHSVFDATKDLAFIPLPKDVKLRGKAAIDGAGSRIGRSGAAVMHQIVIITFSQLSLGIPFIGLVIGLCILGWIWAVGTIETQFEEMVERGLRKQAALKGDYVKNMG